MTRPPTAYSSRFLGDLEDQEPIETGADRYQLRGELGRGGMGQVFLARDTLLDRDVALKRPRRDLPDAVKQQVIREARLTARLPHPGIAPVLDAGDDEEGFYYTMPVLVGRTLQQVAGDERDVVRALVRACEALGFAHARGFVHRDVKPDNLLLGEHGELWVLDWGVALDPHEPQFGAVGTRGFGAPEQDRGEEVGPTADVYSLGRTLQVCVPDLPPELASVVERATAAEPEQRYPTATELGRELEAWLKGQQVQAHAYRADQLLRRWVRRRWLPLGIAACGLVGVGATAAWGVAAQLEEFARAEEALVHSLSVRARAERRAGHRAEAEWLASEALRHGDSADAAGVLTAWEGLERPRRGDVWVPPCDGELQRHALVCVTEGHVEAWADGERLQRLELAPPEPASKLLAAVYTPEEGLVVQWERGGLQSRTGLRPLPEGSPAGTLLAGPHGLRSHGEHPLYVRTPDGHVPLARCDLRPESWDVQPDGRFALGCGEGRVIAGRVGESQSLELEGHPSAVRVHGERVLIGTQEGAITVWRPGRPPPEPRETGCGAPVQLEVLGGRGVGRTERGEVFTFDLRTLALIERLPGRYERIAVTGDSLSAASSEGVVSWRLGSGVPVEHDLRRHGGIATMDVSPDGATLLVGGPDGSVVSIDAASGSQHTVVDESPFVVKVAHFLGEGRSVVHDGVQAHVYGPDGTREQVQLFVWNRARVGFGGTFWVANSKGVTALDGRTVDGDFPLLVRGSDSAYGLRADGVLVDLQRPTELLPLPKDTRRVAVHGPRVYTLDARGLTARDRRGKPLWHVPLEGEVTALGADAQTVAVGNSVGGFALYGRDGALVARVPDAHARRISSVHLVDGVLWTGSWDGMVRRWSVKGRHDDPETLQRAIQSAFGVGPL